jgi:hypothetical protein
MRLLAIIAVTAMLMTGLGCASSRRSGYYDPYYGGYRYPSTYVYRDTVPYYPNYRYRENRVVPPRSEKWRAHPEHKYRDHNRNERRYHNR